MDRYSAINLIVEKLAAIAVVYDRAVFIEEINSFPTISVHCTSERIMHSLSDERYSILGIEIRGYTHNEDVEEAGEAIASEIEGLLQSVDLDDFKIISIETDGGLMKPLGVCIITAGALIRR